MSDDDILQNKQLLDRVRELLKGMDEESKPEETPSQELIYDKGGNPISPIKKSETEFLDYKKP